MSKRLSTHSSAQNNVSSITLELSNQVMLREYPNLIRELMDTAAEAALEVSHRVAEIAQKCLMQLDYLLNRSTWGHEVDGQKWLRLGLRQLQEAALWYVSVSTLSRAMNLLEALGLIKVENLNHHKYDQTRWYTLNAEGLSKLTSLKVVAAEAQQGREAIQRFDAMQEAEKSIEKTVENPVSEADEAAMEQAFREALAKLCQLDYAIKRNREKVDKVANELLAQGYLPFALVSFEYWWKYHCWINKQGKPYEPPALGNVTAYLDRAVQMSESQGWGSFL